LIFEKIPERKFLKNKIEEVSKMWQIVLELVLGVLIGLALGKFIFKPKIAGNLRVDRSEPNEPPLMFLECTNALYLKNKYITLEVVEKNYISQE
jgi:hypothetical protein